MAPNRAFSFPLSHTEETSRLPPFAVSKKDISQLRSCQAFQIVRGLLVDQDDQAFCDQHCHDCRDDKDAWLLQRDITYALILPVLEIYRHAVQVAKALLGNRHLFDLELVFRGEARGAFSWLQCFVMEEEDWCRTKGCPGKKANQPNQPTYLADLSHIYYYSYYSLCAQRPPHPLTKKVMKQALDDDPFWGPRPWKDFEARAVALEKGVEELVRQCVELAPVAASSAAAAAAEADDDDNNSSPPNYSPTQPHFRNKAAAAAAAAPRSLLAQQQQEQRLCIPGIIAGCWSTLLADAAEAKRVRPSPSIPSSSPIPLSRSSTS
ncbi:MAG: hypothetical protein Q9197_002517 [Variospora fuerteventurae]